MMKGRTRGQSLVETALILPIVMLLMMGIVDLGFVLYANIQVAAAAGEGARVGSLILLPGSGSTAALPSEDSDEYREREVKAAVVRAMGQLSTSGPNFSSSSDVTISYDPVSPSLNGTRTKDQMIVGVRYRQPIMFNVLPGLIGDSFQVSSRAQIRIQ